MPVGIKRRSYVSRHGFEQRREDVCNPDEVSIQALNEVAQALKAWEKRQGTPKPKRVAPAPVWHRPYQAKVRQPLWVLLARAAVAEGVASGKVRRAGGDVTGWQDQILDGLSPSPRPALE